MTEEARIRINLAQRELEIAGDQAFVAHYADRIEMMLAQLVEPVSERQPVQTNTSQPASSRGNPTELGSFGEYLHGLPNSATEVDRMLAAGYYCEATTSEGYFSTADANRRLLEHGIKLGNASQCVKQSLTSKRVFIVAKGQYKVSVEGRRYLQRLMGSDA